MLVEWAFYLVFGIVVISALFKYKLIRYPEEEERMIGLFVILFPVVLVVVSLALIWNLIIKSVKILSGIEKTKKRGKKEMIDWKKILLYVVVIGGVSFAFSSMFMLALQETSFRTQVIAITLTLTGLIFWTIECFAPKELRK